MLYNESDEPYLACSHMENILSSKTYILMITVLLLHTVNPFSLQEYELII